MSPARAAVHWALPVVVAPLLFACAGVDEWPAAGRSTNPVAPVAARYQGEEAVPNPANPMVGLRFTGKPCDAVVRVDDSGASRVESSFVPGRAVGLTPVADTFYLGELGDGSALVVQFDGDGASQLRRQLRVDDEAHLRAPQDGVVVLARGEFQHRSDVVRLQIMVVGEDLLVGRTRRQEVEDVLHTNAETTDARASSAHRGIDGNSIEFAHLSSSCLRILVAHSTACGRRP